MAKKNYMCPKCEKDFRSSAWLSRHYKQNPDHVVGQAAKRLAYRKRKQAEKEIKQEIMPRPVGRPRKIAEWAKEADTNLNGVLRYCPCCGANIENIAVAVGMASK